MRTITAIVDQDFNLDMAAVHDATRELIDAAGGHRAFEFGEGTTCITGYGLPLPSGAVLSLSTVHDGPDDDSPVIGYQSAVCDHDPDAVTVTYAEDFQDTENGIIDLIRFYTR